MASGFLVMISYIYVYNIHGEPYNTSSLVECTGYTGKYSLVPLLSIQVFYSLWEGVQLPVGKYISYARCTILVSLYHILLEVIIYTIVILKFTLDGYTSTWITMEPVT